MSHAFVKENEDEQGLHEMGPSLTALIIYLTRENNGIRVYEKMNRTEESTGRTIHSMSNGLNYAKDKEGKWEVI